MTPPFVCFSGIAPTIGDTAIGQSILHHLKAQVSLPIRVHSSRPDVFAALPQIDAADEVLGRLPAVAAPKLRSLTFPAAFWRLVSDLRVTGGARALPRAAHAALGETLRGCAAVVYQGGPTWNDQMLDRRRVLEQWLFLEAARFYRAPVYHVGVSCGPFAWPRPAHWWMAPLCRSALNQYEILFVRDRFSRPALTRLGVSTRAVESTDAAVFLPSAPDRAFAHVDGAIRSATSRRRVVVCVRDYQAGYTEAVKHRPQVLRTLAAVLDYVQRELADVIFLSTDHLPRVEKNSDPEVALDVQHMMTAAGSRVVDIDVSNPSALKHLYSQFDAMISMRLHPTILAMDHGVPCLLLSYDAKCDDFFAQLNLQGHVVPLQRFEYQPAVDLIQAMLAAPQLRADIQARFAALRRAHAADWAPMFREMMARAREMRCGAPVNA